MHNIIISCIAEQSLSFDLPYVGGVHPILLNDLIVQQLHVNVHTIKFAETISFPRLLTTASETTVNMTVSYTLGL